MGFLYLVLPILIAVVPVKGPSAETLSDFSRMGKAAGQQISLIGTDGTVREGKLVSATGDAVTMEFGGSRREFSKTDIASAAPLNDGVSDGIIRGVLVGLLMGSFATQGCSSSDCGLNVLFGSMALYGSIGYALDASQKNPQPLYRATATSPAAKQGHDAFGRRLTLSFRF